MTDVRFQILAGRPRQSRVAALAQYQPTSRGERANAPNTMTSSTLFVPKLASKKPKVNHTIHAMIAV